MRRKRENMILQLSVGILISLQIVSGSNTFLSDLNLLPEFNLIQFKQNTPPPPSYDLRFISIDGEILADPLYFSEKEHGLTPLDSESKTAEGQTLINRIGIAIADENRYKADTLHAHFQAEFFNEMESAEYQIVRRLPMRYEARQADYQSHREVIVWEGKWGGEEAAPSEIINLYR